MNRLLLSARLLLPAAAALSAGCDLVDTDTECPTYRTEYDTVVTENGRLLEQVPESIGSLPMALVLSTDALNSLFRKLSGTDVPELTESTSVLGQSVGVSVQPEIPLLRIGGEDGCADCILAEIPFDVGVSVAGQDLPRGIGGLRIQMPVTMVPESNEMTALVARFQDVDVLSVDLDLGGGTAQAIYDAVEPLASDLLTDYLADRYEDARIASFRSWAIGAGDVLLAGRGPFVLGDIGSLIVGMQSNLVMRDLPSIEDDGTLPDGADLGFVFHPELLGSMARRMNFEGIIPREYSSTGQPQAGGSTFLTMGGIGAADDGLLRTDVSLWRTGSFCGTADLAASIGLALEPERVAFALRDIDITDGRGTGALLSEASWAASPFIDALLETLDVTVNYDGLLGGEQSAETETAPVSASVDGRGLRVYLDLLE